MVRVRPPLVLLIAAAVTSTIGCGPKRVTVNGVEMPYEEGAARVLQEGRQAKARGDRVTAKVRFKEVVDLFEESDRVPDALAELGGILYEEGGCRASRHYLERLAEKYPLDPRSKDAKAKLGNCEPDKAPTEQGALATRYQRATSEVERKEIASSAADASIAAQDFGAAVRWLLRVLAAEKSDAHRNGIKTEIAELIDSRVSFTDVRQLLEELPGNDFPKSVLSYKLGRIQYHIRDYDNAAETLKKYIATWPGGQAEAGAKKLLALIAARSNVKPMTIGVVLPLSGKLRGYGENALQAIQLAFDADGEGKKGAGGIKIVVRDSKGERAAAAQAVQELALDEGAIAIVGPMFTSEAQSAGYKAQEIGIPLITISSAEEIATLGPYVFRNGLTAQAQAQTLVDYCMGVSGARAFAILYPRVPYGESFTQAFWDEVEKRKGEIRGVESYSTEDTTFASQVKSLVARDVVGLRGDFRKLIEECDRNSPDNYRKAKCKDKARQNLRPIVDFDALFIPDYDRSIALISAALAFEDIVVETDPRVLRKIEKTLDHTVKPVMLLGGSGWNSLDLVDKAKRNVENAVFTDAFFAGSDEKATVHFVTAYQKKYNRSPRTEEALIYDSARVVRQVLETAHPATREAMREAIRHVVAFPGVTGKTSFAQGTDAQKEIRLLTIKNGAIQEITAPREGAAQGPTGGR